MKWGGESSADSVHSIYFMDNGLVTVLYRQGNIMDFWAGAKPGSHMCKCGYDKACFDLEKWCNCDSAHDDWLVDGGDITQKEFLPVKSVHFGDTGTPLDGKEGR